MDSYSNRSFRYALSALERISRIPLAGAPSSGAGGLIRQPHPTVSPSPV
jgi:hypothetical protein